MEIIPDKGINSLQIANLAFIISRYFLPGARNIRFWQSQNKKGNS
ncbi:MAG: hypothetical protein AAB267_10135 [Candidatus Desantisbacteria bacterium]